MLEIDFDKIHETFSSAEEIKEQLDENKDGFKFRTKIYRARYYSDLAQDCLEAAFIGDRLCEFAERLDVRKESNYMYDSIIEFTLKPNNTEYLSQLIFKYGKTYSGDDEELNLEWIEDLSEYKDKLEQLNHAFPELVDDYYANYINGEYYEYDPVENKDFFDKEFSQFPERRFGFNKSAFSKKINENFYASVDSIIIPKFSNFDLILKSYSGIENISFLKADFFAIGNITYLISNGFIIHFPFDAFLKAKHCAYQVLNEKEEYYVEEGHWMHRFLTYQRWIAEYNPKENFRGYPEDISDQIVRAKSSEGDWVNPPLNSFYVSSYGDHILVNDSDFSYFFFGTDKLTLQELGFLSNNLSRLFNTTANLAGFHVEIKCPWEQLNDESFEELCFDIIYHNPKFDNSTIRKMGKARSRDGGRDITVMTHSRPGKPSKKYIFQCKYLKNGSSLSGTKVQDISDTVTQYDATGYGIMTSVVIDSTLYDKLDGISRNLQIEIEDYSVYKLERILAGYPQIKQRHFKAILQTENY